MSTLKPCFIIAFGNDESMAKICRSLFWTYCLLAAFSLILIPINLFGFFGPGPNAFSSMFAVLLAQPWASLSVGLASETNPSWNVLVIGVCLVVNALIIRSLCHLLHRRGD